jgi:autoinducer 2 (AI-2) kinase
MPSRPEVVLGLDVGTSSGRAAAVDRQGSIVATAAREWSLIPNPDGTSDFPARDAWNALADATADVTANVRAAGLQVAALCPSSVRGAFVLLDESGAPLWACGSIDARAADEIRALAPSEPDFHARTGQKLVFAALPRLQWLERNRADLVARTSRLATVDGWLQCCLTGTALAAVANASTTGLLDLRTREWLSVDESAEPWGLPASWRDRLPPVAEAGTVVGGVSEAAAERTGLEVGTPVVVGGGDAQLGALGLGCIEPGDVAIVMGSHWQQVLTLDAPLTDPEARFRVICGAIPGTWQADAIAWGAGLWLEAFVAAYGTGDRAALEAAADRLGPGAGGALAVGAGAVDRMPWEHAAPSLLGLPLNDAATGRAAGYRAILESGCIVAARNLRTLAGKPSSSPIRVAGGVSRSDLACRVLASVLGRPVERAATHQATMLGTAICAGTALGWYRSLEDGAHVVASMTDRFEPDPADHVGYRALEERWAAAFDAQLALVHAGVTRPIVSLPN